jgi:hypothetical protein
VPIVSFTNVAEEHKEQTKNSQAGCDNHDVVRSKKQSQSRRNWAVGQKSALT